MNTTLYRKYTQTQMADSDGAVTLFDRFTVLVLFEYYTSDRSTQVLIALGANHQL